jgi:hypothetical protein
MTNIPKQLCLFGKSKLDQAAPVSVHDGNDSAAVVCAREANECDLLTVR